MTASLHSIDGDQEVRFMKDGPMAGDIVSAEPTTGAPFGYRVTVNAFVPGRGYRAVLRFRSATTYSDGNRLAVIDSEMPTILRRLGRWRPGSPLPLPAGACAQPHLRRGELWCN